MPRNETSARPASIAFRHDALRTITNDVGVYALCDLDEVPIYVGQSTDGIRNRVRRHLTSARSDIIANRQVDVWEIAFVWAWPTRADLIPTIEAALFHRFNAGSRLMNGSVPLLAGRPTPYVEPAERIRIMSDEEIRARRTPAARLPRQIEHYGRLVDQYLVVKDSPQMSLSLDAHFERLARYHRDFLEAVGPAPSGSEDAQGA